MHIKTLYQTMMQLFFLHHRFLFSLLRLILDCPILQSLYSQDFFSGLHKVHVIPLNFI